MSQANELRLTGTAIAKAQMLIRRPVAEVFAAIVDPNVTANFWFSRGSARLEPGNDVEWFWETYGASSRAIVREFEPERRIVMDWGSDDDATTVEWIFTPYSDSTTLLQVINSGFRGSGDEVVCQVIGSTEGFALVLAGLKAYLEHGLRLNLVADHAPAPPDRETSSEND
jgi:uncharacterized protein YndB with AHSA1/START domain